MNWRDGLKAAQEEYGGHTEDLPMALMLFKVDPPDTPFQRGYQAGVLRMARKYHPALAASILSATL